MSYFLAANRQGLNFTEILKPFGFATHTLHLDGTKDCMI